MGHWMHKMVKKRMCRGISGKGKSESLTKPTQNYTSASAPPSPFSTSPPSCKSSAHLTLPTLRILSWQSRLSIAKLHSLCPAYRSMFPLHRLSAPTTQNYLSFLKRAPWFSVPILLCLLHTMPYYLNTLSSTSNFPTTQGPPKMPYSFLDPFETPPHFDYISLWHLQLSAAYCSFPLGIVSSLREGAVPLWCLFQGSCTGSAQ